MKQKSVETGDVVFTVAKHKTTTSHGAATLALNEHESELLSGYMHVRTGQQFADAQPFVFITTTKQQMTQSNIASALTTAFSHSGFSDRVNCTMLRKSAVTQVHKNNPEKRHDLASHMCHRTATAEKHYRIMEKKSNSVSCSQLLRDTFGTEQRPEQTLDSSNSSSAPYLKKVLFSKETRDVIFAKFAKFVQQQKTPIADIQETLYSDPELVARLERELNLTGKALVNCVKDKVRSFFRQKYGFKKR